MNNDVESPKMLTLEELIRQNPAFPKHVLEKAYKNAPAGYWERVVENEQRYLGKVMCVTKPSRYRRYNPPTSQKFVVEKVMTKWNFNVCFAFQNAHHLGWIDLNDIDEIIFTETHSL